MNSVFNKVIFNVGVFLSVFVVSTSFSKVYALDLTEYVAQPDFQSHYLSTGEHITFSAEGGSGGVRQYKNTNYEQFYITGSGYNRRDDTSWAPVPGFGDAHCTNGNKAVMAISGGCEAGFINPGDEITGQGAFWTPNTANVGDSWSTGSHTIVPIDSGVLSGSYNYNLPPLNYCELSDLSGYPVCVNTGNSNEQQLQLLNHYDVGEFSFCTGITNPEELIVIEGLSGPGAGDTFYYMKGFGLVGFKTGSVEAGYTGIDGNEGNPGTCSSGGTGETITISGTLKSLDVRVPAESFITASKKSEEKLASSLLAGTAPFGATPDISLTNQPLTGGVVAAYAGSYLYGSGKEAGMIPNLVAWDVSDEDGQYELTVDALGGFDNSYYVAFFCQQYLHDLYKIEAGEDFTNFNVPLYCPSWVVPVEPLDPLPYAARDKYFSCDQDPAIPGYIKQAEVQPKIELKKEDADFTWLGTIWDPDPDVSEIPESNSEVARVSFEGRADSTGYLSNLRDAHSTFNGIIGGLLSKVEHHVDGEPAPALVSCEEYAACNKNILASDDGGLANNQTCWNYGVNLAPYGDWWEDVYAEAVMDQLVCNHGGSDIALYQIQPPWVGSCDGYTLCSDYFPYDHLFGRNSATVTSNWELKAGDSYDQDECRTVLFESEGIDTHGDAPFKTCTQAIYEPGAFSLYNASIVSSNQTVSHENIGGPPSAHLNFPYSPPGLDASGSLDEDLTRLRSRNYYKLGVIEGSLCIKDPVQGRDAGKECSPSNEFDGDYDDCATGYKYTTEASGQDPVFFEDPVTGSFWTQFFNDIFAFFGRFQGNARPGDECLAYQVDWQSWSPNNFCDIYDPPPGFRCELNCSLEDGSGTYNCREVDPEHDAAYYCASQPSPSPPPGYTLYCTYRVGEETADEYGTGSDVSQCLGDIEKKLVMNYIGSSLPGGDVGIGLVETGLSFMPPYSNPFRMGTLFNVDFNASNEKFPGKFQGGGQDFGKLGGSGEGAYGRGEIIKTVGDYNPIKRRPPEAAIPPITTELNCNKEAPEPGSHNVKPVEDLITAIQGTGYAGQVDYDNVRDCYNDVINTAQATGNDPAFLMAIWIEESGASNYTAFPSVLDFGCGGVRNDFTAQITCLAGLQTIYATEGGGYAECRAVLPEANPPPSPPDNNLQVLELFQMYACGFLCEGNAGTGDFDFSCTNAAYWPDQIDMFYRVAHNTGAGLDYFKILPSSNWSTE